MQNLEMRQSFVEENLLVMAARLKGFERSGYQCKNVVIRTLERAIRKSFKYPTIVLVFIFGLGGWLALHLGAKPIHVSCQTTKGPVEIVVNPKWSPRGAARFLQLVDDGFYSGVPLFRCIGGFLCQFGAKPGGSKYSNFSDDIPRDDLRKFKIGYLSFAGYAKDSRSTHIFVALAEAPSLGTQPWETPFGYVTPDTMASTVAHFEAAYGDAGPDPRRIESPEGEAYVKRDFPKVDWITSCARTNPP